MKRALAILVLGSLLGAGTHLGWYQLRQPAMAPGLAGQLDWMRAELQLTPDQFARIKELHESTSPHLLLLAHEVERMQSELAAFEAERKTEGQIDFLEFARFVTARRTIDRDCLHSTRTLIAATAGLMTEQQRTRYLAWLGPRAIASVVN